MPQAPLVALLEYLGKTHAAQELESLTDAQLLERFARAREEAAFAVLMHRHGPMVYGTAIKPVKGSPPDCPDFSGLVAGWLGVTVGGLIGVFFGRLNGWRRVGHFVGGRQTGGSKRAAARIMK